LDFMRTEAISIKTNREFYPAGCSGGMNQNYGKWEANLSVQPNIG